MMAQEDPEPTAAQPARAHGHGHGHGHAHAHAHGLTVTGQHRGPLAAVMVISASIAVAEIIGAIVTGSLVLLADAAHMAADVAGVGLSLLAVYFAARPATARRTFGYARAEILAAMANALLLFGMATFIVTEAIRRLMSPSPKGIDLSEVRRHMTGLRGVREVHD